MFMRVHKHDFMEAGGETERERGGQHLMAAGSQSESELKLAAAVRNQESMQESGMRERERCGCVTGARAFLRICFARLRRHSAESHTHTRALSTDTNTHTHTRRDSDWDRDANSFWRQRRLLLLLLRQLPVARSNCDEATPDAGAGARLKNNLQFLRNTHFCAACADFMRCLRRRRRRHRRLLLRSFSRTFAVAVMKIKIRTAHTHTHRTKVGGGARSQ